MIVKYFISVSLFLLIGLTSCSTVNNEPLEAKAIERWYALIDLDWGKAYSYETPGYRNTHSLDRFKNGFGLAVEWNSIEFVSVDYVNKKTADVNLLLKVTYNSNFPIQSPLKERWMQVDDQWWHVSNN